METLLTDSEILEIMKEELDHPIDNLYSFAVMACLAIGIPDKGCSNCPVHLFNYETRTEYEKCCLHEPCQTNLYKWILEQAKIENVGD